MPRRSTSRRRSTVRQHPAYRGAPRGTRRTKPFKPTPTSMIALDADLPKHLIRERGWMTGPEMQADLGVSKHTFRGWTQVYSFPKPKGKTAEGSVGAPANVFDPQEVLAWMAVHRPKYLPQPTEED